MNDLRKAAEQALEALDSDHPDIQLRAAIALRAALAQPEQDLQLVANLLKEYGLEVLEVIAALKTQPEPMFNGLTEEETNASASVMGLTQPKPEQEPVAWNWVLDGKDYGPVYYGKPPDADITKQAEQRGRTVRLLYTAPPQRNTLPLSDDEIKCIKPICADFVSFRAGVRHAEREHGIGGEE